MPFFPYLSLSCDLGAEASPLGMVSVTRGGLAQLARAPALQAGGQRFESVILHLLLRFLAPRFVIRGHVRSTAIFDILAQARL